MRERDRPRIRVIQPALPNYRLDFFRRLSKHYGDRLQVYYSETDMGSLTPSGILEKWQHPIGRMRRLFPGVEWQDRALSIPVRRGEVIVVCGAPRTLSTLVLLIKARIFGAHSIWWGHYWSATTVSYRHRVRMRLARLADALLFYTDSEVARFHGDGWAHPGAVGALNNGIDLTEVRELRRSYEPNERGQNVLFIGRLTAKAQLGLMVAALRETSLKEAHLHVIGDGAEEEALRAQADRLGVADRITWYGGTTDEKRIAEIANKCAVFAYPGQVGLSLIHAMGYSLPCVVHDQPERHMPEIAAFEAGSTGVFFSEGDSGSLATAVSALFDEPVTRIRMAQTCDIVTDEKFTTAGMAVRFVKFIDNRFLRN